MYLPPKCPDGRFMAEPGTKPREGWMTADLFSHHLWSPETDADFASGGQVARSRLAPTN